jgi:hypothetical protein
MDAEKSVGSPLDKNRFRKYLQVLLQDKESDAELDDLDDYLQSRFKKDDPRTVRACAEIAVSILSKAKRPEPLAYALNTLIGVLADHGDLSGASKQLQRLVAHSIRHDTPLAAESAIANIRNRLGTRVPLDYVPIFLRTILRLYVHYQQTDDMILTLVQAADIYSTYGAFQPAYRALSDAEVIARKAKNHRLLAQVLGMASSVALLEGDHKFAVKVGKRALSIEKKQGLEAQQHIAVNLATAAMQLEKHKDALKVYVDLLPKLTENADGRLGTLVNMSVCHRKLGNVAEADRLIVEARAFVSEVPQLLEETEFLLELELVASANALAGGDGKRAASCLNAAVKHLDKWISSADRLHYRRGVRERYIRRLEAMLCSLPNDGAAADVIPIVAFCRTNQLSDWLHVLQWVEDLSLLLTTAEKNQLEEVIGILTGYGAPFLFGMREKYDDAFEPPEMGSPWKRFSELTNLLSRKYGFRKPFDNANLEGTSKLLSDRLQRGHGILVNMLPAAGKAMLLLGDKYVLATLPKGETYEFFRDLTRHRQNEISTKGFAATVARYQAALLQSFDQILSRLVASSCRSVLFFPDRVDLTPINLVFIANAPLRERMALGTLETRTVLAIFPGAEEKETLSRPLAVLAESTNLQLPKAEVHRVFALMEVPGRLLTSPTTEQFCEAMSQADVLVVAQHGVSIGLFKDPHFAKLGSVDSQHDISLAEVQAKAYRWPHSLVVLGTCHSGGMVSRNYEKEFYSHEQVGFQAVFLTNRRCSVIAATWAIFDRYHFLFSSLFFEQVRVLGAAQALGTTLAKLTGMSAADAIKLFGSIEPEDLRHEILATTSEKNLEAMKAAPLCYGAYQTYGLL